jgi:uncharacterized protein YecE (DUF72 family)
MTIHVGVSGFLYGSWRSNFYPAGLAHRHELAWTSRTVGSIEINGTFYSLKRPSTFAAWKAAIPTGFPLALKGSRFITHMKRLRDVEVPLANFFASGLLALGESLGPMLWQFPAQMAFDPGRFRDFFALLPRDSLAAARLARRHDARLEGRALTRAAAKVPIRHAVEVRHPSFFERPFLDLLREQNIALVVSDGAGRWRMIDEQTADFAYVRLHGSAELYVSGYQDDELDAWASRIARRHRALCRAIGAAPRQRWQGDVFVYFDNDAKVHAPYDALRLMERLGLSASDEPRPTPHTPRPGKLTPAERIARELEMVRAPLRWPGSAGRSARSA